MFDQLSFPAQAKGSHIQEIVLYPFGGAAKISNIPAKPLDEILVGGLIEAVDFFGVHLPGLQAHIGIMVASLFEIVFEALHRFIHGFFVELHFKFFVFLRVEFAGVDGRRPPDIEPHPPAVKSLFFQGVLKPPERIGGFQFQRSLPGFFFRGLFGVGRRPITQHNDETRQNAERDGPEIFMPVQKGHFKVPVHLTETGSFEYAFNYKI
jgi:hypothetical protein